MADFKLPLTAYLEIADASNSASVNKDDFGYDLEFTVKDAAGAVVDLTGVTAVTFKLVQVDDNRNRLLKPCTVSDALQGKIVCSVEEGDFAKAGNYLVVLALDYGGVKLITTEPLFLTVVNSFG